MAIYLKLILAVFIIAWSSILIRWMGTTDPLIISFYRLFFSALALAIWLLFRPVPHIKADKRHLPLLLLAGFFLALHFISWITSLQMTTVGRSIFLESTHPIFALILSVWILKERAPRSFYFFFLISLAGVYFTIQQDFSGWNEGLSGDALALFSAICLAGYLLIARKIGDKIPIIRYLFFVYGLASLFILPLLFFYHLKFWQLPPLVWLLLILLTIGPNLIGHSMLNWASRRIEIYRVNMTLLTESILATGLAALFLQEYPGEEFYLGAALILIGIGGVVFKAKSK